MSDRSQGVPCIRQPDSNRRNLFSYTMVRLLMTHPDRLLTWSRRLLYFTVFSPKDRIQTEELRPFAVLSG